MDDVANRSVTSHPPWTDVAVAATGMTYPFHGNATLELSTALARCVLNATLNATFCSNTPGNISTSGGDGNSSNTTAAALPPPPAHSLALTIFLGVLAGVVSIVTVLGNLTVLLAFGLERSIRQPTNYFIASLAVSDLLIGTFSMPLFTQYLLLSYWPLGPWLCDLWLSLDWTVCLTSQYTVFFITMDRFLSVKIPAKYRNWRTEKKVLAMVAVTWILPAAVFFTTIIGWQYFFSDNTAMFNSLACEVKFMRDPLFTFMLTIGYYWITLVVMCILYGGIYKVALDLQRKSDAKQRKLESTMELAADHSRNTGSNSTDSERGKGPAAYFRKRQKKKSLKSHDAEGSGPQSSDQNSLVRSGAAGGGPRDKDQGPANTAAFGSRNSKRQHQQAGDRGAGAGGGLGGSSRGRQDSLGGGSVATDVGEIKEDERSSSPAFASDDEGSSSGHTPSGKSPKGGHGPGSGGGGGGGASANNSSSAFNNHRRSTKGSLNPKAGIAGIVNTALLTTPDTFRASLDIGRPTPLLAITAPPQLQAVAGPKPSSPSDRRSLSPALAPKAGDGNASTQQLPAVATDLEKVQERAGGEEIGTPMPPSGQQCLRMGGPSYSRLQSLVDDSGEQSDSLYSSSAERSASPVLSKREVLLRGCPYIDEKSFMQLAGGAGITAALPLSSMGVLLGAGGGGGGVAMGDIAERESPLWKRRSSLPLPPLAGDIFDIVIDDDFPSYSVTEITTLNPSLKLNGGKDVSLGDVNQGEHSEMGQSDQGAFPSKRPLTADEAAETDSQRLSEPRQARGKGDGRLHSFVKSVRSRNSRRRNRRERKSKSENRARKALRTITIILGAFVLCWTPYHIMLFIIAIVKDISSNVNLVGFYNFTYWLCYLNSPINPFCYAFANAQFKRTFLRILRFDWHRT